MSDRILRVALISNMLLGLDNIVELSGYRAGGANKYLTIRH